MKGWRFYYIEIVVGIILANLQVHINNAGDWTGALHARHHALMQLAPMARGDPAASVSESLRVQPAIKKEEQCIDQRLQTTTSHKQAGPQHKTCLC